MRALWCSLVLGACSYAPGVGPSDSVIPDEVDSMPPDGPEPGAACGWTFSPKHIGDPCAVTPGAAMTLTAGLWSYDTATGMLRDPAGTPSVPTSSLIPGELPVRVLSTTALDIDPGAELRVAGPAAFGLLVDESATIDGAIDVSATSATAIAAGPGGSATTCELRGGGIGGNALGTDGGGGGGGGGFGTAGASGAQGAGASMAPGGIAGVASADDFALRGGCAGGLGGIANSDKGVPGAGGGVLLLVVKGSTAVGTGAQLRSGGVGGVPGGFNTGGSGGGSGGMIAIQTASLAVNGVVCANGGGGAGGSADTVIATAGQNGSCSVLAAAGGTGPTGGGGGAGAIGTTAAQPGSTNLVDNDGAGGGGGGVGRVYFRAASIADNSVHSPAPILLPFDGF